MDLRDSPSRRAAVEYLAGCGTQQEAADRHGVTRQAVQQTAAGIRATGAPSNRDRDRADRLAAGLSLLRAGVGLLAAAREVKIAKKVLRRHAIGEGLQLRTRSRRAEAP